MNKVKLYLDDLPRHLSDLKEFMITKNSRNLFPEMDCLISFPLTTIWVGANLDTIAQNGWWNFVWTRI